MAIREVFQDFLVRTDDDSGVGYQPPPGVPRVAEQGVTSFGTDISEEWAKSVVELVPNQRLLVRTNVREPVGGWTTGEVTKYVDGFKEYRAKGIRVVPIFPQEFYAPGGSHGDKN
jgi:hypothetical protein